MTDRNSNSSKYRMKTTPNEPINNSYLTEEQVSGVCNNTGSGRETQQVDVSLSCRQAISRSIIKAGKASKTTTYSRLNTSKMVECMSAKQLSEKQVENRLAGVDGKYYSTANLQLGRKDSKEGVVDLLRDKCSNYEKTIYDLYEGREQQMRELQSAKDEISRLRDLYEGKLQEVNSVSHEITTRIEKQQAEKNLFIKQINNKNIEINKLRESYAVIKAQNETLNLMLREKEGEVDQLEAKLEQIQLQKEKLQNYELAVSDSNNMLRDIEQQMHDLDRQSKLKDHTIEELRDKVNGFSDKIRFYEEKISELEYTAPKFVDLRAQLQQKLSYSQAQAEEWRQSYLSANRQLEHLPEIQIKLKNALSTNEDLQIRIQDLLESQQKLKLQMSSQNAKERRITELQASLQTCQRTIKQKIEQVEQYQEQINRLRIQSKNSLLSQQVIASLEKQLEEKMREYKHMERKFDEKTILSSNIDRQLKRLIDENDKFHERNEKIDQIFKQNKRLTGSLMDKINQIEQLQHAINSLESRVATLSNEVLKLNSLYEQSNDTVTELNSSIQSTQIRLDCQINLKVQLQEKCERLNAEVISLSKSLSREKESLRSMNTEKENLRRQLEQSEKQQNDEITKHEMHRATIEAQLLHERSKLEQVNCQVRDGRRRVEQLARKEKEQHDVIMILESDKRVMLAEFSTLRTSYEQAVSKLGFLEKWRSGYLNFMGTLTRTAHEMQQTSQQLLV